MIVLAELLMWRARTSQGESRGRLFQSCHKNDIRKYRRIFYEETVKGEMQEKVKGIINSNLSDLTYTRTLRDEQSLGKKDNEMT